MGAMNYVQEIEIKEGEFPRFRLGMWVGATVSPNDLLKNSNRGYGRVSFEESLDHLMIGSSETEGTILQFEVCPWCGDDSDHGIKSPECWSISEFNGQPSLIGICPNEVVCSAKKREVGKAYLLPQLMTTFTSNHPLSYLQLQTNLLVWHSIHGQKASIIERESEIAQSTIAAHSLPSMEDCDLQI